MARTEMLIGGRWRPAAGSGQTEEVTSPYDASVVGTVPVAGTDDVEAALSAAEHGARTWRHTPAHERMRILLRAAELADQRAEDTARLISGETGKTITEGTGEDKVGFTLRQPCGVVVAITPFNYPALLVLHKLAPALAAGNAVVLKPARTTPLTALALAACFVDAGLPEGVLSVLTGSGGELGDALVG